MWQKYCRFWNLEDLGSIPHSTTCWYNPCSTGCGLQQKDGWTPRNCFTCLESCVNISYSLLGLLALLFLSYLTITHNHDYCCSKFPVTDSAFVDSLCSSSLMCTYANDILSHMVLREHLFVYLLNSFSLFWEFHTSIQWKNGNIYGPPSPILPHSPPFTPVCSQHHVFIKKITHMGMAFHCTMEFLLEATSSKKSDMSSPAIVNYHTSSVKARTGMHLL